jgi:hypothetical protein
MSGYMTFGEYLAQRDAALRRGAQPPPLDARGLDPGAGTPIGDHLSDPEVAGDGGRVEERSIFSGLFKNPIKAVNPSRPVLPTNSLLLASPFNKKRRLKSQIIGR